MTMIDEDWLAEALRHLGTAIEVPGDGPERVLAARGGVSGRAARSNGRPDRSGPSRRRQLIVVGVALATVGALALGLVLARRSTNSSSSLQHQAVALPDLAAPKSTSAAGPIVGAGGAQGQLGPALTVPPTATSVAPGSVPEVQTKVIKTGSVDLQVGRGKLSPTVNQLTSLAGGLGGYVANATTSEVGPAPTADMTLRVPVGQFETLLTRTRQLGTPTVVTTSGQDVTSAYVDLNAQIQALEATQTQYLQILAKATTIGDILSVEQQLSGVQTQLQQLEGQQMVLADQTSFGTLTVHVSQTGSGSAGAAPSGLAKAWDHARSSFAHGVEAVIGASGGVLVFLVAAGLLLLAGRLVWPVVRRRLV